MYAAAAARSDGLLLLCGGRNASGTPLGDAYGLARHRDGRWEWAVAPGEMPIARYQHAAVFVQVVYVVRCICGCIVQQSMGCIVPGGILHAHTRRYTICTFTQPPWLTIMVDHYG